MKKLTLTVASLLLLMITSCKKSAEQIAVEEEKQKLDSITRRDIRIKRTLNSQEAFTMGVGGSRNSGWYCPDNVRGFPPVDIKSWYKVRVVNGRLPTYEESQNGTSLIYYDVHETPDAKPYNMVMPRLASVYSDFTQQQEIIIVIQVVQTSKDTLAGYRFLTGGNGTSDFRDIHFFTNDEVNKLVKSTNINFNKDEKKQNRAADYFNRNHCCLYRNKEKHNVNFFYKA